MTSFFTGQSTSEVVSSSLGAFITFRLTSTLNDNWTRHSELGNAVTLEVIEGAEEFSQENCRCPQDITTVFKRLRNYHLGIKFRWIFDIPLGALSFYKMPEVFFKEHSAALKPLILKTTKWNKPGTSKCSPSWNLTVTRLIWNWVTNFKQDATSYHHLQPYPPAMISRAIRIDLWLVLTG